MDLTVHQIRMPEGHLKELYKASGTRHNPYDLELEINILLKAFISCIKWSVILKCHYFEESEIIFIFPSSLQEARTALLV